MAGANRSVPQRIKPVVESGCYGTAETVPLSGTRCGLAYEVGGGQWV